MFKDFHASKALVGFFALFFAVFNFTTCSSDGGDPAPPPRPRSSDSGYKEPIVEPDTNVTVNISEFDAYFPSERIQEELRIKFAASISIADTNYESKFDSVRIFLSYDGKSEVQNSDKGINIPKSYSWNNLINVAKPELCGKTFKVCYEIYAKGRKNAIAGGLDKCKDVTREERICNPSSSSFAQSSSSIASISLSPVNFSGRINQNTGVKLSTGDSKGVSESDIYYKPNPDNSLMAGSNVKIMQNFMHPSVDMCTEVWSIPGAQTGVENPTNTSQFGAPCGNEEISIFPYMPNQYYLVKTNNASEWSSGWFIVLSGTRAIDAAGTVGLELKIWKVN
jgi:hypothetical protein